MARSPENVFGHHSFLLPRGRRQTSWGRKIDGQRKREEGRSLPPSLNHGPGLTTVPFQSYCLQLSLTIFRLVTVMWPCSFGLSMVLSLTFSLAPWAVALLTVPVTVTVWPTCCPKLTASLFTSHVAPLAAFTAYSLSLSPFAKQPVIFLTLALLSEVSF